MSSNEPLNSLRSRWQRRCLEDSDLLDAWKNIGNMMFKGNIAALIGASKLIAQMDWWDGITEWLEIDAFGFPIVKHSIHLEERPLYAFVILNCRALALKGNTHTWLHQTEELFDWGKLSIQAASLPTLGEIPDWMMESLMLGCIQEVEIPSSDPATEKLWMLAFPITQALFEAITEKNPSLSLGFMHPVDSISWFDAIHFCNSLSEAMGYEPVYEVDGSKVQKSRTADGYQLPTVQDWIDAATFNGQKEWCFAGSRELWTVGVYDSNTSDHVGRNTPTKAGLYDMSGNVWEWCWSDDSRYAPRKGGSWMSKEEACAINFESKRLKTFVSPTQGIRLCRKVFNTTTQQNSTEDDWGW